MTENRIESMLGVLASWREKRDGGGLSQRRKDAKKGPKRLMDRDVKRRGGIYREICQQKNALTGFNRGGTINDMIEDLTSKSESSSEPAGTVALRGGEPSKE